MRVNLVCFFLQCTSSSCPLISVTVLICQVRDITEIGVHRRNRNRFVWNVLIVLLMYLHLSLSLRAPFTFIFVAFVQIYLKLNFYIYIFCVYILCFGNVHLDYALTDAPVYTDNFFKVSCILRNLECVYTTCLVIQVPWIS